MTTRPVLPVCLATLLVANFAWGAEDTILDFTLQVGSPGKPFVQALPAGYRFRCVDVSRDGKLLALAGDMPGPKSRDLVSGAVIFDMKTGKQIKHFFLVPSLENAGGPNRKFSGGGGGLVYRIRFSHNGRHLFIASDEAVTLWDLATNARTVLSKRRFEGGYGLAISANGSSFAVSHTHEVRLWDSDPRRQRMAIPTKSQSGLAFSPNGKWLATAEYHNRVHLWDVTGKDREPLTEAHARLGILRAAAFTPDSRLLAVAGEGGATVYKIMAPDVSPRFQEYFRILDHRASVPGLAMFEYGKHGTRLVTAGQDGNTRVWDIEDGILRGLVKHDGPRTGAAVAPDGTIITIGYRRSRVGGPSGGVISIWGHVEP